MPADPESRFDSAYPALDTPQPRVVYVQAPRQPAILWMIVVLLAVIATALVMRWDDSAFFKTAFAQSSALPRSGMEGARGIYAFTGQVSARSYGLFMVDVDTGTVWCYELQRTGTTGEPRLKLLAARSWVFDRYLEEFNTSDPIPAEVREMVQQQRSNRAPATRPTGAQP